MLKENKSHLEQIYQKLIINQLINKLFGFCATISPAHEKKIPPVFLIRTRWNQPITHHTFNSNFKIILPSTPGYPI